MSPARSLIPIALVVFAGLANADTGTWPEYRGPTGDGRAADANLPVSLAESNLKWKTPIHGKGWSSPVVWGDQIWLTTATEDGTKMSVICVDRRSGDVVHDVVVKENSDPAFCHPLNSYATPTPVIEEGRIYVHFGSYLTACLDTETADFIWKREDLPCDHYRGPASSPILYDGKLFVHVIEVDGKAQLVYPSAVATIAYDPASGKELWKVYHDGMNASARPLYGEGLVFITNGMGSMVAVSPTGSGDVTGTHIAWSDRKGVAKKSSQLLIDGLFYMISDDGVVSCREPKTGEIVWQKRLGGEYAASPIYAGGRIYLFSRKGKITTMMPGLEFKQLAATQLGDGFMASPAVVGDEIYLRSKSHLYCLKK